MLVSPPSWQYGGYGGVANAWSARSYAPSYPAAYEPFRLVYFGDVHENYKAFPRLKTAFRHFVAEGQRLGYQVLQASAGDSNTGKEAKELELNTHLTDEVLNPQIAPVIQVDGNHEFDAGAQARASALALSKNPTLVSNVNIASHSPLFARVVDQKFRVTPQVITMPGGARYGAIGVTVPSAKRYMNSDARMEGVHFLDMPETLQRIQAQINWLEQTQGVSRIVLTTHIGLEDAQKLAKNLHGVDVIIAGHDHNERFGIQPDVNYVQSGRGEPVMIVNAGGLGEYMGVLDTVWDPWGRVMPQQNQLYKVEQFEKDPKSTRLIENYLGVENTLTTIAEDVSTKNARVGGENAVANSVADAIRKATQADIAFFRGTELRANVDDGSFTERDLNNLLPFSDNLAMVSMTGAHIMAVLNESARCLKEKESHPGIIHAGGLRYRVDRPTGRVIKVRVFNPQSRDWEPLDPQRRYRVAIGEYALKNKSEYPAFLQGQVLQTFPFCARQVFGAFLKSQQEGSFWFKPDGRLQVVDDRDPTFAARQATAPRFQSWA